MSKLWTDVDRFITDRLVPEAVELDAVLQANAAAGLPAIDISPAQGKWLYVLARAVAPRRILEIGTLGAYSTIWLARALPPSGRMITLEYDPKHAEVARANLARAGLAAAVEVRVGKALDSLPRLEKEGCAPFDFIFIDADKHNYPEYLAWSVRLAQPGTLIVADNVVRDGAILDGNAQDENVRGIQRFYEALAAEPRVSASVLQTVGRKGYDGFAVAVVG